MKPYLYNQLKRFCRVNRFKCHPFIGGGFVIDDPKFSFLQFTFPVDEPEYVNVFSRDTGLSYHLRANSLIVLFQKLVRQNAVRKYQLFVFIPISPTEVIELEFKTLANDTKEENSQFFKQAV